MKTFSKFYAERNSFLDDPQRIIQFLRLHGLRAIKNTSGGITVFESPDRTVDRTSPEKQYSIQSSMQDAEELINGDRKKFLIQPSQYGYRDNPQFPGRITQNNGY